ncbi:hypothetical protein [Telmatospirillum sp.]|uniref:O-antigen ligase family protein n=1 Tax=Telmatospirillum sp. TaxID=2079197 RepID=UPI00284D34DC|nr:hypothetical protein [Telmatospirillum sp.]MDR3441059.1 hypothetical protein [Telmatospirillum sp.]
MTTETAGTKPFAGDVRLPAVLLMLAPVLSLHKSLVMAPILAVLATCLLWGLLKGSRAKGIFVAALSAHRPLLIHLGLLLAWCAAASLWSFNPLFSLNSVLMLAGTFIAGWITLVVLDCFTASQWRPVILALAAGLGLAGAAMLVAGLVERCHLADIGRVLWNMDADATVVALLVWPVLAWLDRFGHRRAAILLFLVTLAGVFMAHDIAAKVAMLGGGLAWIGGRWWSAANLRKIAVVVALGSLLTPLAALHLPPSSVSAGWTWLSSPNHHRLTIWSFSARHIIEKPFLGWGFDGARAIPGGKTQIPVVRLAGCRGDQAPIAIAGFDRPVPADCVIWEESLPLHPHDAWLQVWLELGAVGAILVSLLLMLLISGPRRSPVTTKGRTASVASLVVGLTVCSVSFGAWQSWWLSCLWIAAALIIPLLRAADAPGQFGRGLGNRGSLV